MIIITMMIIKLSAAPEKLPTIDSESEVDPEQSSTETPANVECSPVMFRNLCPLCDHEELYGIAKNLSDVEGKQK